MGKDVNSRADDFSFAYYPEEKRGYVASNRGGMADDRAISTDNIYAVNDIIIQEIAVKTRVIDKETREPIKNAKVEVYNDQNKKVKIGRASCREREESEEDAGVQSK